MSDSSPTALWECLTRFHHTTRKSVNVLVAYNADAAAAAATTVALLRASLIPVDVHPIASYVEMGEVVAQTTLTQDYTASDAAQTPQDELFLLIGLGGAVDLETYFDLTRHIVLVLDAYRPVHLNNLRREDRRRLWLWDSAALTREVDNFFTQQRRLELTRRRERRRRRLRRQRRRQRPRRGGALYGEARGGEETADMARAQAHTPQTPHEDEDEDNGGSGRTSDAEDGPARPVGARHGRRCRGSRGPREEARGSSAGASSYSEEEEEEEEDEESDEEEEEEDEDFSASEAEDAEVSASQTRVEWRDKDELPAYLEELYYAAEGAGRGCALEVYNLAVMLNRHKDVFLWHAAVGVCDLFLRRLIDYGTYLVEMRPLHDAVSLQASVRRARLLDARERAATEAEDVGDAIGVNGVAASEGDAGPSSSLAASLGGQSGSLNGVQLHNRDEEQLFLLRHTSLWQAIWYHPLIASALGLHHVEDGKGFLAQLLASQCGVSMRVAQQPWRELAPEVRQEALQRVQAELRHLLDKRCSFAVPPNQIRCIRRTAGYSAEVSTFDTCWLFTALLAAVPPAGLLAVDMAALAASSPPIAAADLPAAASAVVARRLQTFQRGQFWRAYTLLDVDPNDGLFQGAVRAATALQRAVADATGALMQPGMVQSTRGVHYAQPYDPTRTTTALEAFNSPFRLAALAQRLLYTLTVERGVDRRSGAVRPLLLCGVLPRYRPLLLASATGGVGAGAMGGGGTPGLSLGAADSLYTISNHTSSSGFAGVEATAAAAAATGASELSPSALAAAAGSGGGGSSEGALALRAEMLGPSAGRRQTALGRDAALHGSSNNSSNVEKAEETRGLPTEAGVDRGGLAEQTQYVVLLAHEGSVGAGLTPLPAVGRFNRCVSDEEEFAVLPERVYCQRTCLRLTGRENTIHLAELMHLCSLEPWNPRRDHDARAEDRANVREL